MKLTGSSILGQSQNKQNNIRASNRTIDYKILQEDTGNTKPNPYGSISVHDMLARDAKAQFDGACAKYPVPDTRAMFYKAHG